MLFIWPLPRIISRDFYFKSAIYINGQHGGVDIPASIGTPIKAIAAGKVTKTGRNNISGYFVEIAHSDGWVSNYRHMVQPAAGNVGASVAQGQAVGKVGSTGWSTGPHLHLDLWNLIKQSPEAMYKNGIWAHDPELYLGQEDDDMTPEEVREIMREELQPIKDELAVVRGKVQRTYNQVNTKAGVVLNGILSALKRITVKWDV